MKHVIPWEALSFPGILRRSFSGSTEFSHVCLVDLLLCFPRLSLSFTKLAPGVYTATDFKRQFIVYPTLS